jgi:hypothetical protein
MQTETNSRNDGLWIGPAPSIMAITALLLIGTVGMEIAGIQTVLLEALVVEKRLSTAGLGWATTAELLTLGLGIILAGSVLRPIRLRQRAALAALVLVVVDLLVLKQSGLSIVFNRGVAGFAEGLLVWLPGCMIARSASPARWAGIFLTLQAVGQLAFTALMPLTLMQNWGANGGFIGLAVTAAVAILAAPFIPSSFVDLPKPARNEGASIFQSPAALASLVCVLGIAAFSIGLFAYLGPLATQAHLDTRLLGFAVSASLAAQIVGSAIAAVAAKKFTYYPIFALCVLINVAVLWTFFVMPAPVIFIAASAVFGFFWMFFLPFQVPLVIEADPTRRVAVILSGAQLLGCAAGPYLCSFFVTDADSRPALFVCGACFLGSFVLGTVLHLRHRYNLGNVRQLAPP